jgi:hypothetical protein
MSSESKNLTNKSIDPQKAKKRKKGVIIGIAVIIVALAVVFGPKVFKTKPDIVTEKFGKMEHEVTYDRNNITDEEVVYLAHGLIRANFFDEAATKFVFIKKTKKTCEFSISVNPLVTSNPEAMQAFVDVKKSMQGQFPNNPIILHLVVYNFNNVIQTIK